MPKKRLNNQLSERYPILNGNSESIEEAIRAIISCYSKGKKVMLCGNGGSSAQADHAAAELMKSFKVLRPLDKSFKKRLISVSQSHGTNLAEKIESGLPALSLCANTALISAISNDIGSDFVYAQQIAGIGEENDILIAISTSGNSANVVNACVAASAMNLTVIGLTGISGGKMKEFCDILIDVPSGDTAEIQELHLPVIHEICSTVEEYFFTGNKKK